MLKFPSAADSTSRWWPAPCNRHCNHSAQSWAAFNEVVCAQKDIAVKWCQGSKHRIDTDSIGLMMPGGERERMTVWPMAIGATFSRQPAVQ